ncbi:haloacid dehalogenase [Paenibacillus chitinolyticus]|uniref:HAD-IA family hydrolase n=1 Tax=Paenibacillus chitinolyticus TaxID=79263 RepID=A0A410WTQ7_9BACL|nr:HAD-IA family hydrolase [Paenibacillus chitinolyticus]MCY9593117.1 HAD-IA family hydrolase [Paenibacillus chitinolyticus]MCY9599049.1 HAD-IA family hydrolase [Paenibacillus chitinolyticus]QAV17701.1 haloacid dehalogenase [Paenibacillus chitinolyticus]
MNQSPAPQAMLFDLDGTLFKTETLLLPAYHAAFDALRREGVYEGPTPSDERILGGLGMLLEEIWERVLPDVPAAVRSRADELLLAEQMDRLLRGEGMLYDGVEETLQALHARGIQLFVASNGLEDYVREVIRMKGLAPLFTGLYSAGEYATKSKVDLVKLLLEQHGLQSAWMVGDRSSDVEAGHRNGLKVIGCDYAGFRSERELDEADVRITAFPELLGLLPRVEN